MAASLAPVHNGSLAEITPKNWHRYPQPVSRAMLTPAYVPVFTYSGSSPLTAPYTPIEHGAANVLIDDRGVGEYTPRTQSDRAQLPGNAADPTKAFAGSAVATDIDYVHADPINTPFGSIEPQDPYPKVGDTPPAAPVLSSLSPNTAAIGQPSIIVEATGTGFTPYSVVEVGGTNYAPTAYVSPTKLRFPVDTMRSSAGTISVKVLEHNIKTAAVNFTFT
jgi:hypothetical protein